ncbi:tRNA (adenosine(37)-N6)-threonylcarbamoyltransferase complex ATPase subunit type 1 TsaE [Thermosulfurimonas marina]|uniref:tRNA threonylcarbamoyladenosine biosynthesis protein TsaE n=1 Tax=Thermosulfurimonas marina TaxID=2047767 RepID=A0A6H1WTE6_9BACT|nr:tRNA (adenosine(37)-N6)-threonylcarbamoyltransferase complex ATPase subunit type 1 TsaE [Thermosulfurimonas marina]QJA06462.1 tRNA (adenosine(37)-N6)-threonylcarbamoyltransferase complex ATPase subunit type 1 TsaE [Thermosulfurimonas marina]
MPEIYKSRSPEETRALAEALAQRLSAGDLVALIGDLGSGKTTFVQGLARGLGVPPEIYVTSPSFTLVNEYPGRVPLFHVDLYRISPEEVEDLGLSEMLSQGVVVVEWAERLPEGLSPRFVVRFKYAGENERIIELEEYDRKGPPPEGPVKGA